ncbi:O-antigen ligase family protein [Pedobacter sp. WC2501]|uniref:O-antigen ligase family protein n=1 Tax=Pedobacter sp. WC2501 TaxID=3461400 RepID=UPI0040453159
MEVQERNFHPAKKYIVFFTISILFSTQLFSIEHARSNFIEYDRHAFYFVGVLLGLILSFREFFLDMALPNSIFALFTSFLILNVFLTGGDFRSGGLMFCLALIYYVFRFLQDGLEKTLVYIFVVVNAVTSALFITGVHPFGFLLYFDMDSSINTGVNANYFASVLPFAAVLCFRRDYLIKYKWSYPVILFLTLSSAYILIVSKSRIGYIAVFAALGYLLVHLVIKKNGIRLAMIRLKHYLLSILLVSITGYAIYSINPRSVQGRLLIYKVSARIIRDYPFFGCGPGNFKSVYNIYQADYFREQTFLNHGEQQVAGNTYEVFNEPLRLLVELGIIGSAVSLLCLVIFFHKVRISHLHTPALGAIACLISISVCGMQSYPLSSLSILVNGIFFVSFLPFKIRRTGIPLKIGKYGRYVISCIIILFYAVMSHKEVQVASSEYRWSRAALASLEGNFYSVEMEYRTCYRYLAHNGRFLFNYGAELNNAGKHKEGIEILNQAAKLFPDERVFLALADAYESSGENGKALRSFDMAINIVPGRFYSKYKRLKLLVQLGHIYQSHIYAKEILNSPVKIPSPEINMIRKYATEVMKIAK